MPAATLAARCPCFTWTSAPLDAPGTTRGRVLGFKTAALLTSLMMGSSASLWMAARGGRSMRRGAAGAVQAARPALPFSPVRVAPRQPRSSSRATVIVAGPSCPLVLMGRWSARRETTLHLSWFTLHWVGGSFGISAIVVTERGPTSAA